MEYLKLNNIIRVLSVGFLIALINKFGFASSMGIVFILAPYLLLFLLANQAAYKTKFRIFFRSLSGALVCLIAIGILFVGRNEMIGIGYAVALQYGVIFVVEAIIGLFTYDEIAYNRVAGCLLQPPQHLNAAPHRTFPKDVQKQAGRLVPTYPNAGFCFSATPPKPGRALRR